MSEQLLKRKAVSDSVIKKARPVLEMRNISKTFPGVKALTKVSLTVLPGEIHSIVGENGAGKSTLMKILAGVYSKDSGEIVLNGKTVTIDSPQTAIDLGIGTVYQNLDLIPSLSVAENIYMNQFPRKSLLIDRNILHKNAEEILKLLDCRISPAATVDSLSVADQQMVAIARVLSRNISILILDEPTSSLSPVETQKLFENVRRLRTLGVATLFISHHMDEIFDIAEHVTVLCDGKLVGDWPVSELNKNSLVKAMVGHEVREMFPKIESKIGGEVFRVEHISVGKYVHDISFNLRKGEIVGLGGLVGAGRSWLVKSLFGAVPGRSGDIFIEGKKVTISHPRNAKKLGIGFVPEDRHNEGLISGMSIEENIGMCNLKSIVSHGIIVSKRENELAEKVVNEMDVKASSAKQLVENLSGGNQQKIVLGKWFENHPRIMIFDEPTKGIDVGAKSEILRKIGNLAASGIGVLLISSELPELMGVSDRIIVISLGYKTGEFKRTDFDAAKIMLAATSKE